ncbi:Maf family nucleotide pyrophosphatase [Calidifontimicrobium sp. SYSU G02091]|uniref:Maf family protein n=1 Tax=Calidifontimicrobium sp. SYSU G02091 TaxID=2926421 RepID=UPI001F52DF19|nr:Maf family protein [Calidifontimicrobium sp. SYSU G02091]MCI1191583.1 Maf family nucleotide pyrophosphatase [Calidifontimicrobium sp. SYSU G02091]
MSASFVYLASQSPRRRQLLAQIGVPHELLLPDADEDAEALEAERPGEAPEDYVVRVTRAKLDAALARWRRRALPPAPVLAADTTVALGRQVLGKPADTADARAMLARLSGRTHRVLTAVALAWPDADPLAVPRVHAALSTSHVRWRALTPAEIDAYVASGEPMGKAGAYAIQSGAARWTEHIDGSYSGIMGLPLFEVDRLLAESGWKP